MGKILMGAVVSLDGYIAADDDGVGPLFDWYGNGDVEITLGDPDRTFRVSEASAAYIRSEWSGVRATVIGRRLFDITNGWGGVPAAGEHVFVVTHRAPTDWPYPDAPFTFVTDGVAAAIEQAATFACDGDGDVSVTAGQIGGQAVEAGLVDEVHLDLVPVVFGGGKPFFGSYTGAPRRLEDPRVVVGGDRVLHLIHPVRRRPWPRSSARAPGTHREPVSRDQEPSPESIRTPERSPESIRTSARPTVDRVDLRSW